jgi:hypothetical protein
MYTYAKDEVDVAIVMTYDEVHDLRYVLREYMLGRDEDIDPKFVQRVAFWHSVLSGPVYTEDWYDGTDEEDDDDVA